MGDEIRQVVMTPEMLQSLLASMGQTTTSQGNFSRCTHRFDGTKNQDVQTFIDAITVYKECLQISDANALKGMPMLLQGQAAVWWQGVKGSFGSFNDAIEALKHAFGFSKPAHQIYRELFSKEQKLDEKTDLFVSRCRALLSQLPSTPVLPESIRLDMIYGLLHLNIREKVPRDNLVDFEDLIREARKVEVTLQEIKLSPASQNRSMARSTDDASKAKPKKQCNYCKAYGHVKEECRKLSQKKIEAATPSQAPSTSFSNSDNARPQVTCFGCGAIGYIRSNCPTCKAKPVKTESPEASLEFKYYDALDENSPQPVVSIEVEGKHGTAILDTGAKTSMAGTALARILVEKNVPSECKKIRMTLADGKERFVMAQTFKVPIVIQGKLVYTNLVAVPDHVDSRTLLGGDFLQEADIVIDMPKHCWYFGEDFTTSYPFVQEVNIPSTVHTIDMVHLRSDEGTSLTTPEMQELNKVLQGYEDVFEPSTEATPFSEHCIVLTDDVPIAVPPYRMSEPKKEILREELDKLLNDGTIEECDSPYAAPVVLVPKKDGGTRLCVDYRRINAVTKDDKYPLPRIDDLLHMTKKSAYISTLDLKSGYHQISVRPCDRDKTAFVTPFGIFRYTRMPFGLKGSPATFMRLMDRFKTGLHDITLLVYLDDLIVLSPSFEEHISDLRKVFERLRSFKLALNRKKCSFGCLSVKYLGHLITPDGLKPDPSKVEAIKSMPAPQNVKQLLTFLQTASWFRRFINKFSEISRPLSALTKKKAKWEWGPSQQEAFDNLKTSLTTSPILRQADPRLPYILRTDASSYALGACLLQGEGPDERPVEFASRLLTDAERNYCTTQREALAAVWAIDKFRGYLDGATIIVQSDHQPLKWLLSLKSPNGRLARWALSLQELDLKIEYTPGKLNVVADTLSRPPIPECEMNYVSIKLPTRSAAELREEQIQDPDVKKILDALEQSNPSFATEAKCWSERGYLVSNGILYRYVPEEDEEEPQLVIPKSAVSRILAEYHDSPNAGHFGIERTLHRISSRYYWPKMRRDVSSYLSNCVECQKFKIANLKPAGLLQTPVQSQRFETLSIDLFGPLPETSQGFRWIFIVEDTASRWVELFPLQAATAEECAKTLINEVMLRYGIPRLVISDNGPQFVSEVMQKVAYCLGFTQSLIPSYHPASNPVERKNRDLKTQLAMLVNQDHTLWSEQLSAIRFALNSAKCKSTGYTPAYLTFGRELRTPDDVNRDLRSIVQDQNFVPQITSFLDRLGHVLKSAGETHEKSQDDSRRYADAKRRNQAPFALGDRVLVETHTLSKAKQQFSAKFAPKRDGPYIISRVVTPTTFEVSSAEKPDAPLGKYHISALTPCRGTDDFVPIQPLRRRGRPPKAVAAPTTSVPGHNPETKSPTFQKKTYNLRPPRPKTFCLESRTGRTRDSKGEIVRRERDPNEVPSGSSPPNRQLRHRTPDDPTPTRGE